jgi:hypothetical protein
MGVDELYRGKKDKFLTVVCNLETGEPLWFGKTRKKETLDESFRDELWPRQRKRIEAACVDMWEPFRLSIEQWAPQCKIVYDKFHIIQHANDAIDEVRKAEFFRQGKQKCFCTGRPPGLVGSVSRQFAIRSRNSHRPGARGSDLISTRFLPTVERPVLLRISFSLLGSVTGLVGPIPSIPYSMVRLAATTTGESRHVVFAPAPTRYTQVGPDRR